MSQAAIQNAKKAIPAEIHMISGCRDEQTSADVSNVASFSLPDPKGRAGGALTASLLNVTYADHKNTGKDMSFQETLLKVRDVLKRKGFSQIPQLSSSRPMDISKPFDLVPERMTGTRRAVMM
jgi:metacaspase-1